tara:strand:- start:8042 stop:8533 length:492 start_codon:yes stop_codon:yes gene_type:complete
MTFFYSFFTDSKTLIFIVFLFVAFQTSARSDLVDIRVIDGDTVSGTHFGKVIKIRLAEIDAPEMKQNFGIQSKKCLKKIIGNSNSRIIFKLKEKDRYQRSVGWLFSEGKNLNKEMILQGCAWVYDRYAEDQSFFEAQDFAKKNKLGLWKTEDPIKPWIWRRKN